MRVLTGMQSSGNPHIGNYFGMIKPALEFQDNPKNECFYFIADLHSFTSKLDPEAFHQNQKRTILDWLALGLDPEKSAFYQQSDIRAHTELFWILMCGTPMGLLERAHSYKDKIANNIEPNGGLFSYPVLMACDILLYDAEVIPVGKDQKQHVEMTRDIAQKFNHHFGETFTLPEARILKSVETVPGLDGRKMSKSYGNTIDIFEEEVALKKKIMSIPTDSVPLGQPLNPDTCQVFAFHTLFANPNLETLRNQYKNGDIGFGDAKKQLFTLIWDYFQEARERRTKLQKETTYIEKILTEGAQKANSIAEKKLGLVRSKLGLSAKHLV